MASGGELKPKVNSALSQLLGASFIFVDPSLSIIYSTAWQAPVEKIVEHFAMTGF